MNIRAVDITFLRMVASERRVEEFSNSEVYSMTRMEEQALGVNTTNLQNG